MIKFNNIIKWCKSSKAVFGIIGFLVGRTVFFSAFNPFVIAYTTAFFLRREFYTVAFMTMLGLLTVSNEINVFRYLFSILMLVLFNYCVDREDCSKLKTAVLSALSTFAGGIIYTFFSNMAPYYFIMTILETVLSATLYIIIGDNISIFNFFDVNVVQAESYSKQVQLVISQKLKKASEIFLNVAHTYETSLMVEEIEENKTRINIIENICDNVCQNCQLNNYCWHKNADKTYTKFYKMVDKWLKAGCVNTNLPFTNECSKSREIYMLAKGGIEKYNLNKLWLNKTEQSKLIVGRQLEIMSEVLGNLHGEVAESFNIDKALSNKIYKELTGLSVNSVVAIRGKKGYEITVSIPHYYGCNNCGVNIGEHIGEILNAKLVKTNYICRNENNSCVIQFAEAPKLNVAPYMAGVKRDGSEISGDCYTYMELDDGKYLLALADGMGSGSEAREESAASIEMYEGFMEAGFNQAMALEIINSVLVAENDKEYFSTLDICTIDRYTGEAEFVKIGAVSTFIISDDTIELIKSQTLPVGILGDLDTEVVTTDVHKGDIIIMVTDGILDSTGNVLRNEKWVMDLLSKNMDKSPKAMANLILNKAKENSHSTIRDDMTILVAQIY